jgi:dienelactone hydrolase
MAVEDVIFESEGQRVVGTIHRPGANAPYAVMLHGYCGSRGDYSDHKYGLAERLADDGIGSLRFDFRSPKGHKYPMFEDPDRPVSLVDSDEAERTITNMLSDTRAALRFVKEYGASKIGLLGSSMGGWPAIFAAARHNSEYDIKALVTWSTAYQFNERNLRRADPGRERLMEDCKTYDINGAQSLRGRVPHLIVHGGKKEIHIPTDNAWSLSRITGGKVKIYDSADHRFEGRVGKQRNEFSRKFLMKNLLE